MVEQVKIQQFSQLSVKATTSPAQSITHQGVEFVASSIPEA